MTTLHTTTTGHGSGMSNEEEAVQALVQVLSKYQTKRPVLLCGGRAFAMWLEILCGTSLVSRGVSSQGAGKDEFKMAATISGRVQFVMSNETINTRSGMAWKVEETPVSIVRNSMMEPDQMVVYDGAVVAPPKGARL